MATIRFEVELEVDDENVEAITFSKAQLEEMIYWKRVDEAMTPNEHYWEELNNIPMHERTPIEDSDER